jgi:large subunit ribosomal protein L35
VGRFLNFDERGAPTAMSKLKTHKAAAKRLKVTAGGKILRMKGYRGHLRRNRSQRSKQRYDKMFEVSPGFAKRDQNLLPYGTT